MNLETIIGGLVGVAFGLRAFDDKRAAWARVAYAAVGFDLLKNAYEGETAHQPAAVGRLPMSNGSAVAPKVTLAFKEHKVRSIQERVAYIHEQMVRSTRDPKVYALAREIVGKRCGNEPCVPEKNALKGVSAMDAAVGEVKAIHQAVQDRVRYVFDPTDYDAFQTAGKTWELRTGDCDDMVVLEGALLRTIGMPVRTRCVATTGFSASSYNHIYSLVRMPDNRWVALDPIMKDRPAGWQVPKENWIREPFDADVVEKGAAPRVPTAKG